MWVDAVCHPAFAATFDVTADKLPALAAVAPAKGRYCTTVMPDSDWSSLFPFSSILMGYPCLLLF